jgi:ABC-type multidrug transport system ATPase subunit
MDLPIIASFQDSKILNGNLEIEINDVELHSGIVYISGANGSGKTTFIRGMIGRLSIQGIHQLGYEYRKVGYVPQDYRSCLFPWMSARANLTMFCEESDEDHVLRLASRMGLDSESLHRRVFTLSGGQCQRVALAREIAWAPSVLFADEPFASLDATSVEQVSRDLAAFQKAGGTVVLTSHVPLPSVLAESAQIVHIERKGNHAQVKKSQI